MNQRPRVRERTPEAVARPTRRTGGVWIRQSGRFTVAEKVALYDGYVAYSGRFEVDTARRVVIHLPEADLSRLYIGRREERHFELVADRLVLTETWTQSGVAWSGMRVLRRVR